MIKVKLKILNGSNTGKVVRISKDEFVIGRSNSCHLRPSSDTISRKHCVLRIEGDTVSIEDLKSRNGVFINGDRIEEKSELSSGDRLKIGKLLFEVKIKPQVPQQELKTLNGLGDTLPSVERPSVDGGSSIEDSVNGWLVEDGEMKPLDNKNSTETRRFRLDETDRISLEEAAQRDTQRITAESGSDEKDSLENNSDEDDNGKKTEKKEKKEPGKLPKRPNVEGKNSRDAAENMLRKFFTRR